ncbi:unnamed protein product [Moneuplotes crassus]|uniref:Uncharacterized protein n=1 Tax=Euplotes crassus TaxID=5936 RepID=A0AAD1XPA8_EUPCR|nr:unnamed protein product [Moneuplotes crassus]
MSYTKVGQNGKTLRNRENLENDLEAPPERKKSGFSHYERDELLKEYGKAEQIRDFTRKVVIGIGCVYVVYGAIVFLKECISLATNVNNVFLKESNSNQSDDQQVSLQMLIFPLIILNLVKKALYVTVGVVILHSRAENTRKSTWSLFLRITKFLLICESVVLINTIIRLVPDLSKDSLRYIKEEVGLMMAFLNILWYIIKKLFKPMFATSIVLKILYEFHNFTKDFEIIVEKLEEINKKLSLLETEAELDEQIIHKAHGVTSSLEVTS